MDNIQLSQANQVYISNQAHNKNATSPIQPQAQQVENGESKINKVLLGLGILGTAAIGISCVIRGRKPKSTPNADDIQKLVKQFQDINFNNGQAKLKDGTLFTGVIEDTLKSGDKVTMEYIDGVIQKSTKTTNGAEIIKEYVNGVISKKNGEVVDIKKVQDEVKAQQAKLKELLANGEITSEEFKKQTDEIKFKSNNDKTEIEKIYNTKVETEKAAKEEAERLAQEAQEKAEKEKSKSPTKDTEEKIIEKEKLVTEAKAREIANQQARAFAKKHLKELDDILLDENGKIYCQVNDGIISFENLALEEIVTPFNEELGTICHRTSPEAKKAILKDGFKEFAPTKNYTSDHATGGIYFVRENDFLPETYGNAIVRAKYKGKIAYGNTETLDSIKNLNSNKNKVKKYLKTIDKNDLSPELIIKHYIRQKLESLGYSGILCTGGSTAKCKQLIAFNTDLIEIID